MQQVGGVEKHRGWFAMREKKEERKKQHKAQHNVETESTRQKELVDPS
jgi:hypothetical protein